MGMGISDVLDGAGETLILLGIVVLETDLEVNGLDKFAYFGLLRGLEHLLDALVESLLRNLGAERERTMISDTRDKLLRKPNKNLAACSNNVAN